jgi:hypothetical protein
MLHERTRPGSTEVAVVLSLVFVCSAAVAQTNVLTGQYDNARSGANLSEQTLTTANVNVDQFGKIFSRSVTGYLFAQPLYVSNVNLPTLGLRNVVYVATTQNGIYAFDADDPNGSNPIWQANLGAPVPANENYFPAN